MLFGLWPSSEEPETQKVPLPLQALDRCSVCDSQQKLRLCANCGEVRDIDVTTHDAQLTTVLPSGSTAQLNVRSWIGRRTKRFVVNKIAIRCRTDLTTYPSPGETDRIELRSFYPFLGLIVEQFHNSVALEGHPALNHIIVDGLKQIHQADGTSYTVISLGDQVSFNELVKKPKAWWPQYPSVVEGRRLRDRITREGNTLLINTAICIALLAELYTTTSDADAKRQDWQFEHRTRLTVKSCPIADFGVMAGSVNGPNIGRLAYYDTKNKSTTYGQDPNDHYWIYFTTLRGEVLYLDCGLYTLNPGDVVDADPYVADHLMERFTLIPAFLRDSTARKTMANIHTERGRTSVLKNTKILEALLRDQLKFEKENGQLYSQFMQEISGKEPTPRDKRLVTPFVQATRAQIRSNLLHGRWKDYPPEPTLVPDIYDLIRPPRAPSVKQSSTVFAGLEEVLKEIEENEARARTASSWWF